MAEKRLIVDYKRPFVTEYQKEIIDCPQRFTVIEASTKSGKTAAMIIWLFEEALKCKANQSVYWVAPVYGQAKIAFDRMKIQVQDKNNKKFMTVNDSRLTITLRTGGIIWFKSADNPDSLYGDDCYAAVIDEASRCKEAAWYAVRSTLTKTGGKCKLIGNVKGRKNFFYRLGVRAKSDGGHSFFYKKITAYDAVNAGILNIEEIEDAKRNLPDNVFRELYLAEPSEDGSNPFGASHIAGCVAPMSTDKVIAYGIDLAKSVDYTAIVGLDKMASVCDFRMFQKDWRLTTGEIINLPLGAEMAVDSTGVGDPIAEDVIRGRQGVEKYLFTSRSKQQLMEGLAMAIQKRLITFPDGVIRDQLDSFEFNYSRTGVTYSAPSGEHDDAVCALALAWYKWQKAIPSADGPSIW